MRVKLLRPWGVYRAGRELTPATGQGKILIARGLAVRIEPDAPPVVEQPKPRRATKKRARRKAG